MILIGCFIMILALFFMSAPLWCGKKLKNSIFNMLLILVFAICVLWQDGWGGCPKWLAIPLVIYIIYLCDYVQYEKHLNKRG